MFEYFPGNYMWSLAVNRCLAAGGLLGEIHWACGDLHDASRSGARGDAEAWHSAWLVLARQVEGHATEFARSGSAVSAAQTFLRASQYYQWAEAFLPPDDARASTTFDRHLSTFAHAAEFMDPPVEIIEIPFEESYLTAYHLPARNAGIASPAVILSDGLDGTKEEMFYVARALSERGIACLAVDQPGQGATLRLAGLPARHDSEVATSAAYDYLVGNFDVDPRRIGLCGASMGGYYAPRAVAFEKRIKACVAWSAVYDYRGVWLRRLNVVPGQPVSLDAGAALGTTGSHLLRILGVADFDEALDKLGAFRLEDVADRISCDILLVHGESDAQMPLPDAEALFAAIGSDSKELRVYTQAEGGASHVQLDRPEPALSRIADWFVRKLGEGSQS
ncbi:alpha/beta hydrolase [Nocardia nova]|uniref:alpha/beta hydrolase n=1 Tax=Nocardia nova TaxID=37330 RepID=UPI0033D48B4E